MKKEKVFQGLWQPFTQMKNYLLQGPRIIDHGEGVYVFDVNGKKYLDGASSLWNVSLGHGVKEIQQAIIDQVQKLEYSTLFRATNTKALELADLITEMLPEPLNYLFFTSNGSDSIETSIKMARQYFNQEKISGKSKIISLKRAYHGVSFGALSASGFDEDKEKYQPLVPGFIQVEPPYCYRCPYQKTYPACGLECADSLERVIEKEKANTIAAFIIEPVMGFGGIIIPPKGYLKRVHDLCKKNDILLIFDEVTTGFGRTGKLFAYEHEKIIPDIMAFGKCISAGYLPLGAVAAADYIYQKFYSDSDDFRFNDGSTNAGNPICCAAGIAAIKYLQEKQILKNINDLSPLFLEGLRSLTKYSIVGDVRGIGFMFGIELVDDQESKKPLSRESMAFLIRGIFMAGLWLHSAGNMIYIMPPFVCNQDNIQFIVGILDKILRLTEEKNAISKKNHI